MKTEIHRIDLGQNINRHAHLLADSLFTSRPDLVMTTHEGQYSYPKSKKDKTQMNVVFTYYENGSPDEPTHMIEQFQNKKFAEPVRTNYMMLYPDGKIETPHKIFDFFVPVLIDKSNAIEPEPDFLQGDNVQTIFKNRAPRIVSNSEENMRGLMGDLLIPPSVTSDSDLIDVLFYDATKEKKSPAYYFSKVVETLATDKVHETIVWENGYFDFSMTRRIDEKGPLIIYRSASRETVTKPSEFTDYTITIPETDKPVVIKSVNEINASLYFGIDKQHMEHYFADRRNMPLPKHLTGWFDKNSSEGIIHRTLDDLTQAANRLVIQ